MKTNLNETGATYSRQVANNFPNVGRPSICQEIISTRIIVPTDFQRCFYFQGASLLVDASETIR